MARTRTKITRSGPAADPSDPARRLLDWAMNLFVKEGKALVARVAVLRDGRIDEIKLAAHVRGLGTEGVVQAAAVFARTAGDDQLAALLAPGKLLPSHAAASTRGQGLGRGWAALRREYEHAKRSHALNVAESPKPTRRR